MSEDTKKPEVRAESPVVALQRALQGDSFVSELTKLDTKHIAAERQIRIILTQIKKNRQLGLCEHSSIMSCVMDAHACGLPIDGKSCYIIPYGKEAKLIISYLGLMQIARRSGKIANIHTDVVHEADEFSFGHGSNMHLKHNPALVERGEIIAAYSYVKMLDGSESFEVLSREEIDKVRKASRASTSGPWADWFAEMAKKTAFRRHAKSLDNMPAEFNRALERDYDGGYSVSPAPTPSKPASLRRFVRATKDADCEIDKAIEEGVIG